MSAQPTEPERDDQVDAEQDDQHTPEPERPEEPQQPAEVVGETETGKVIALRSDRGSLTLRPGQKDLDPEQHWALKAIGIDTKADPGVVPHLRAFVHMCQVRGLDPFAREAYLIGRGKDRNRKYTMQVGIDGYRKMAGATKRFIRVKKTLWTGSEDDDQSYVQVTDEDGDVVRQRVWYDQWPASRGNPGAAKVVIEHYDEYGNVTTTNATADWGMYAPYSPKYEGWGSNSKKVRDDQGNDVLVLNEMWTKGGPHMLAKCAEALAHRKAFPGAMAGVYVHEEMHRLDQVERDQEQAALRAQRQAAYQAARGQRAVSAQASVQTVPGETVPQPEPAQPESGPLPADDPAPVGETVPEVVEAARERAAEPEQVSDEQRAQWLREEIAMLADAYGQPEQAMYARQERALDKPAAQFTAHDLWRVAAMYRKGGSAALKRAGREAEGNAYAAAVAEQVIAPVHVLLGLDEAAESAQSGQPPVDVDPSTPHAFVNNQGVCKVEGCERFEDDSIHEV